MELFRASSSPAVSGVLQQLIVQLTYGFLASIGFFVSQWEFADHLSFTLWSNLEFQNPVDVYDFIVVGSGSSGAVVANRLSENPKWRVLLLEAGGEPHPFHMVPMLSNFMLNYKEVDWGHLTVPQSKSCFGLKNRQAGWSQGRSLGGTSNLNFLIYLRGNPHDFDHWANMTGDPSWDYEHVLPYFQRSERYHRTRFSQGGSGTTHGFRGPVSVEVPSFHNLAREFVSAGQEMGYNHVDLNGFYTQGFDYLYYTSQGGRRDAVYHSYIQPGRKRPNLSVYKYALVTRVLLRDPGNEAYGVEFIRHGKKKFAYATKEVIVSAGAIQTPKILMHSGIGHADHLQSFGIPVKVNLPVGDNLQDHMSTYLGPFIMDAPATFVLERDITLANLYNYVIKGTGPLTSSYVSATSMFTSTWAKFNGQANWPDLQLILSPVSIHKTYARDVSKAFLIERDLAEKYYKPSVNKDSLTILVAVGRPLSRGVIRLLSANPKHTLFIDPRYYDREEDAKRMVEGMKFAVNLVENSMAFKKFGRVKLADNPLPGCEVVPFRSDAYWDCYMRYLSISLHHISGTATMGRVGSPETVVDTQLRVLGTKGLRVVDASVIPVIPVSNIQAVCMMIGEKGADLIKSSWSRHSHRHTDPFTASASFQKAQLIPIPMVGPIPMPGSVPMPIPIPIPIPIPMTVPDSTSSSTTINSFSSPNKPNKSKSKYKKLQPEPSKNQNQNQSHIQDPWSFLNFNGGKLVKLLDPVYVPVEGQSPMHLHSVLNNSIHIALPYNSPLLLPLSINPITGGKRSFK